MFTLKTNTLTKLFKPVDNQLKRSDEPLPKTGYLNWLLIGGKGSGKSTVVINALKHKEAYRRFFDNIYLVSPTALRDPKFDKLRKELDRTGHYFQQCDPETIGQILQQINDFNDAFDEDKKKRKPHNLIIFDDCLHQLPKSSEKSIVNELYTQNRHYKTSVWTTSQKYKSLSPLIRNQCDLITLFRTNEATEKKGILEAWSIPVEIWDYATEGEDNPFLHINFFAGKPVYYRKFDKIIL